MSKELREAVDELPVEFENALVVLAERCPVDLLPDQLDSYPYVVRRAVERIDLLEGALYVVLEDKRLELEEIGGSDSREGHELSQEIARIESVLRGVK